MRARHLVLLVCLLGVVVFVVPVVFIVVLSAARPVGEQPSVVRAGVAVDRLPPLAKSLLSLVTYQIGEKCPELDVVRVLAEVQAESGWNPLAWSEDVNGGAAGLLQINQANWLGLGSASAAMNTAAIHTAAPGNRLTRAMPAPANPRNSDSSTTRPSHGHTPNSGPRKSYNHPRSGSR